MNCGNYCLMQAAVLVAAMWAGGGGANAANSVCIGAANATVYGLPGKEY